MISKVKAFRVGDIVKWQGIEARIDRFGNRYRAIIININPKSGKWHTASVPIHCLTEVQPWR